jgi:predicted Zn-dependent protease with MMP-like domain
MRGPLAWPPVPAMLSRRERFDEAVLDALHSVERRLTVELPALEVAVEDVPPSDPAPWEDGVALGRLFPAHAELPARLVVYRRPVEAHAREHGETAAVVHQVVAEQIAQRLGIDPDDVL